MAGVASKHLEIDNLIIEIDHGGDETDDHGNDDPDEVLPVPTLRFLQLQHLLQPQHLLP